MPVSTELVVVSGKFLALISRYSGKVLIVILVQPIGGSVRYRKALKTLDTKTPEELMALFDRVTWTLGIASLSSVPQEPMDTEVAVVIGAYLIGLRELRLGRFLSVLLNWLAKRHHLLHPAKLLKMARAFEAAMGEQAVLRLSMHVLRAADPRRFQNFESRPLTAPFYAEPKLAAIVDQKLEHEGFFLGLPATAGFRIPKSAFPSRDSDLLTEENLLKRNEQLRQRLLHGTAWRTDAVLLLRDSPKMTASELADTLMLSYEPAHRLVAEISRYRDLGFEIPISR